MLKIKIIPINKWIGAETKEPRQSQFQQTYANTKKILAFELEKLGAIESSIQIEMFIRPEDLRNDGELRANAKPYRQGVILSFSKVVRRLRHKVTNEVKNETQTLSYPCDAFDDWQDNLRAIALSLEALRKVARYGVFSYEDMVSRLALPSADGKLSDRQTAAEFIAKYSDYPPHSLADSANLSKAYKQAAAKLHPDKGGSSEDFLKLTKAMEILTK